jgi:hypothetical protein
LEILDDGSITLVMQIVDLGPENQELFGRVGRRALASGRRAGAEPTVTAAAALLSLSCRCYCAIVAASFRRHRKQQKGEFMRTAHLMLTLAVAVLTLAGTGTRAYAGPSKGPFVCATSDTRYNDLANSYGGLKRQLVKCAADPGYAKDKWDRVKGLMQDLEKALKVAEAAKCPDTCLVNDQPHDLMAPKYPFSDVKRDMPALRAVFAAGKDAFVEKAGKAGKDADDAKYGQFRKLLKGDKLAMWEAEKNSRIYGIGKKVLESAAALKAASVWFTHTYNTTYPGSWRVTGVRFKGDKKIKEWVKEGTGRSEAPASAFK